VVVTPPDHFLGVEQVQFGTAAPEPGCFSLLAGGLAAVGFLRRRLRGRQN